MRRSQYDKMASGRQTSAGTGEFRSILCDVLEHIYVEDCVEPGGCVDAVDRAGDHPAAGRQHAPRDPLVDTASEIGVRLDTRPVADEPGVQIGDVATNPSADFKHAASNERAESLRHIPLPIRRVREQLQFGADVALALGAGSAAAA